MKRLTREQVQLLEAELCRMAKELAPITVRGLYYQAVISAHLPFITKDKEGKTTNYGHIQRRVLELRRCGCIPWRSVVDESRPDYSRSRWTSPAGFAATAPLYYRLDLWADQQIRPLVMVEKAGQVPVYRNHADRFGIDVAACKGYSSSSHLHGLAKNISRWIDKGQQINVLICADFDPSGTDWPRAAETEIRSHLTTSHHMLKFQRVLVTDNDLHQLGPSVALRAPNPNDTRTRGFLNQYGFHPHDEVCVEMDAINPNQARTRLEHIYRDTFNGDLGAAAQREQQHRQAISDALASLAA